ncbi:MAG: hypothetical protein MUC88_04210 [Planctomycetes bacterium]|jgi:hypothetical protein|nr:hypothetical protein [Planctomycetota bacterium]
MAKKINPSKVSIVVFLTALIWVWADLAIDERLSLVDVRVEVAKSSNPALWVNFVEEGEGPSLQTSVPLDSVVLKGPAARVAEVRRLANRGRLDLNLFLVPEREGITQAGDRTLDVLDFLTRNEEIRQLELTVESCEPKKLTLRAEDMVKVPVVVECVGLDASRVQVKSIVPDRVDAYVPKGEAEVRKAAVRLTPEEQTRAKTMPIDKTPYIELVPGQQWEVSTRVKVQLAPAQNVLGSHRVPAVVGICFSQNMQGKFEVVLKNDPTELAAVMIQATDMAKQAYEGMPYQLLLYVKDSDRQSTEPEIQRELEFCFPEDYVRQDAIRRERDVPPPKARFTLVPKGATSAPPEP